MPAGVGTIIFVNAEVVAATCWTEVLAALRGLKQVQEVQYRESHLEAVGRPPSWQLPPVFATTRRHKHC